MPILFDILNGNSLDLFDENQSSPYLLSSQGKFVSSYANGFDDAPKGSIAVIPIEGPIVKNDGFCGEPGTRTIGNWIQEADRNPNISAIILNVDSPGGEAAGSEKLSQTVKSTSKPTLAFIDSGMAASAGYWIVSPADEIYASGPTDLVGSIGAYTQLLDFTQALEKEGIKVHEIYSTLSTEKNKAFKDALDGNYETMQDRFLDPLVIEFQNTVRTNRKGKITNEDEVFAGQTLFANDALKAGLIDGIATFDAVVSRVTELANEQSINNNMKFKVQWTALADILSITLSADQELEESHLDTLNSDLEKLQADWKSKLDAATKKIGELEGSLAKTKADFEKFKSDAAADPSVNDDLDTPTDDPKTLRGVNAEAQARLDKRKKQ